MDSKPTYRIKDWEQHFEVSQSKNIKSALNWVAIPTKHDGKSFRRLLRSSDPTADSSPARADSIYPTALYGAWILIVQVAAKCPNRGTLADSTGPLDAEDLALKTDAPQELFENAFKVLCSERIGWLEVVPEIERTRAPLERTPAPLECATSTNGQTDKQTEQTRSIGAKSSDLEFSDGDCDRASAIADAIFRKVQVPPDDRQGKKFVAQVAAAVVAGRVTEALAMDAAEGVAQCKPDKPIAYFRKCVREACKTASFDFEAITGIRVRPPVTSKGGT